MDELKRSTTADLCFGGFLSLGSSSASEMHARLNLNQVIKSGDQSKTFHFFPCMNALIT